MKKIKEILIFIFGKDQKRRYRRLCLFVAMVFIGIMLMQNVKYDKEHGLSWQPAATITVTK